MKTANYRHECPADCGTQITPGDSIVLSPDGEWYHELCLVLPPEPREPRHKASPAELQPGEQVCTDCHLVHPGECF